MFVNSYLFTYNEPMRIKLLLLLFSSALILFASVSPAFAATAITVNTTSNDGPVNPFAWGVNAPEKSIWWAGDNQFISRISAAKIKLIRAHPIQEIIHAKNNLSWCTSPTSCDFTLMDQVLKTVFDAGAQPIFQVTGYPGGAGIGNMDWNKYAQFMSLVVTHYNKNLALAADGSRKLKYFEMWNEPTWEPDGKIPTDADYKNFVTTVGTAMKNVDSSIKLIGPVPQWADLRSDGELAFARSQLPQIDILSWHDYGPTSATDQSRMNWTKSDYFDNVITARNTSYLAGGPTDTKGTAITEYHIALGTLSSGDQSQYYTNYGATWLSSAISNFIRSKITMATQYDFEESGINELGLTAPTSSDKYFPRKTYYSYYIYGNHMGSTLLTQTAPQDNLESVFSRSSDGKTVYAVLVNKDVTNSRDVTITLQNAPSSGSYKKFTLDANTDPITGIQSSYSNGSITLTLGKASTVALDISTGGTTSIPGDINGDGKIDGVDYVMALNQNLSLQPVINGIISQ